MTSLRRFAPVVAVALWLGWGPAATAGTVDVPQDRDAPPCGVTTDARIVAVGDVHGAYDAYLRILRTAGLVDDERRWSGGRATLVQIGDVLDRGPDSRKALDLLRGLEREAERAGGRVILLLGNHEVMRMQADLRYADAAEFDAFRTPSSEDLRERAYQVVMPRQRDAVRAAGETFDERAFRARFMAETPLGLVEMQQAFGADGEYGRWLRRRDVIATINEVAFVHGGVSPSVAARGCEAIASMARTELREDQVTDPAREGLLLDSDDGPLWYRGLVDDTATAADMTAVLDGLDVNRMIVGHTVTDGRRIETRFDDRLIAIDTGMLGGEWYPGGVGAALEIAGGVFTAIYEDRREILIAGGLPRR